MTSKLLRFLDDEEFNGFAAGDELQSKLIEDGLFDGVGFGYARTTGHLDGGVVFSSQPGPIKQRNIEKSLQVFDEVGDGLAVRGNCPAAAGTAG